MKLETLLERNRSNYYKMLVIVDNARQHGKIIEALHPQGWQAFNVTDHLLVTRAYPGKQTPLCIGRIIKEWFRNCQTRLYFMIPAFYILPN